MCTVGCGIDRTVGLAGAQVRSARSSPTPCMFAPHTNTFYLRALSDVCPRALLPKSMFKRRRISDGGSQDLGSVDWSAKLDMESTEGTAPFALLPLFFPGALMCSVHTAWQMWEMSKVILSS